MGIRQLLTAQVVGFNEREYKGFTDNAGRAVSGGTTRIVFLSIEGQDAPVSLKVRELALFSQLRSHLHRGPVRVGIDLVPMRQAGEFRAQVVSVDRVEDPVSANGKH